MALNSTRSVGLALALAGLAAAGCGDGADVCPDPQGRCITARFSFAGGEAFDFAGAARVSSSKDSWVLAASDGAHPPWAMAIHWQRSEVAGPGTHTPNLLGGAVDLFVTRPHPTDASQVRVSNTRHGTLTFTAVSHDSGGAIRGTFDGIRLVRSSADDTIDLTIGGGRFAATAP